MSGPWSLQPTVVNSVGVTTRFSVVYPMDVYLPRMIDSGLVGSTNFLSFITSTGRGTTRAEDAQGTPTQSDISTSILVYEDNFSEGSGSESVRVMTKKKKREGRDPLRK